MPHPICVTFLYQSSINENCRNKYLDDAAASSDTPCTTKDGDFDAKLLSILMQQKTNHSIELNAALNYYEYESKYHQYLERSNSFHTFNMGMIMDDNYSNNTSYFDDLVSMNTPIMHLSNRIDTIRQTLPLDFKRPTVNRRFYYDAEDTETGRTTLVQEIERLVYQALINATLPQETSGSDASSSKFLKEEGIVEWFVYCNRYLRILEYDVVGEKKMGLPPHTDGIKICEQRHIQSTHTLLLYLSDCTTGGETVIMDPSNLQWSKHDLIVVPHDRIYQPNNNISSNSNSNNDSDLMSNWINVSQNGCPITNVALGIPPQRGRIFLFPHPWPHAGAIVDGTVPKIMLRAEVTIQFKFC